MGIRRIYMRKKIILFILSFLYSSFLVVGYSFNKTGSFEIIENNLLTSILIFLGLLFGFFFLLKFIFNKLDSLKEKKTKESNNKIIKLFNNKTFIFCLITELIDLRPRI